MKHEHYDLIIEWANGATVQCLVNGVWLDCDPAWEPELQYRVKPKMVKVGRHEWPEPLKKYVPGAQVWTFSFEYTPVQELGSSNLVTKAILEGAAHSAREAAEQHRAALRCINVGDIN